MRFELCRSVVVPVLATFLILVGCGTESDDETSYHAGFSSMDGGGAGETGRGADDAEDAGDRGALDVNPGNAEPTTETILYAHNRDTLYEVDPEDPQLSVREVGKFDCVQSDGPTMTDIAVDRDGKLYGVSSKAIFLNMEIEGKTVKCNAGKVDIDEGSLGDARFFGLTFAPPTPKLGNEETLIGANTIGELYIISRTTGELTAVGKFGRVPSNDGRGHAYPSAHVNQSWSLSGDMVFLMNEGSPVGFATLRDCEDPSIAPSTCSTVDTLVEIDVSKLEPTTSGALPIVTKSVRGQILPNGCNDGSCGFGSIYGIAAFDDRVYGFSRSGILISIDNDTGTGQLFSTPLAGNGFAGAGVTTLARVIPPSPK